MVSSVSMSAVTWALIRFEFKLNSSLVACGALRVSLTQIILAMRRSQYTIKNLLRPQCGATAVRQGPLRVPSLVIVHPMIRRSVHVATQDDSPPGLDSKGGEGSHNRKGTLVHVPVEAMNRERRRVMMHEGMVAWIFVYVDLSSSGRMAS